MAKRVVLFIFCIICCIVMSWAVTCGFIKLITICFDIDFSWRVATGIWLALGLIGGFMRKGDWVVYEKNQK